MDDKQVLLNIIKDSDLPQDVKDDLSTKIVSQGITKELAKEVADLLDLQADVFDLQSGVAGQKAQAYEDLAKGFEEADKQEDEETGKIVDEADKQLDELEKGAASTTVPQGAQPQPQQEAS